MPIIVGACSLLANNYTNSTQERLIFFHLTVATFFEVEHIHNGKKTKIYVHGVREYHVLNNYLVYSISKSTAASKSLDDSGSIHRSNYSGVTDCFYCVTGINMVHFHMNHQVILCDIVSWPHNVLVHVDGVGVTYW